MSITEHAMVVKLSISKWTARRFDKAVSEKVAEDYNTNGDAGRYWKSLINKEALKKIERLAGEARTYHYFNTLPWDDSGGRLLPTANFKNYSSQMRKFQSDFDVAVREFVGEYDNWVEEAQDRLGGMYKREEYPSKREIESKYALHTEIDPIPAAKDFRVDIAESERKRIQAEIEARMEQREKAAMSDLYLRLAEVVKHFADKLADKGAVFRNSLVGNIVEMVELLPKLNISNDPDLETMRREIEAKLCNYDPDTLREEPGIRNDAAENATEILDKMKAYTG